MLNSRYAPAIALAVLGVVLVGVLGWFFAIQPQMNAASDASDQAARIRSNTELVRSSSAQLDQFRALLEADDTTAAAIALNAPPRLNLESFRSRLWAELEAAGVEMGLLTIDDGNSVEGWSLEPSALVSNQVAGLFATGPVGSAVAAPAADSQNDGNGESAPATTGGWTPVVTPITEAGPVAGDIRMVGVQLELVGSASQIDALLTRLMDPQQQLFQVYDVTQTSGGSRTGANGAASAGADLAVSVFGALYVQGVDLSVIDEPELGDAGPFDGAFATN